MFGNLNINACMQTRSSLSFPSSLSPSLTLSLFLLPLTSFFTFYAFFFPPFLYYFNIKVFRAVMDPQRRLRFSKTHWHLIYSLCSITVDNSVVASMYKICGKVIKLSEKWKCRATLNSAFQCSSS